MLEKETGYSCVVSAASGWRKSEQQHVKSQLKWRWMFVAHQVATCCSPGHLGASPMRSKFTVCQAQLHISIRRWYLVQIEFHLSQYRSCLNLQLMQFWISSHHEQFNELIKLSYCPTHPRQSVIAGSSPPYRERYT